MAEDMVYWNYAQLVTVNNDGSGCYYREGNALSTATKPTGADIYFGSKILEIDTGKVYSYDATTETWLEWGGDNSGT